jgi:hypothetical protein
MHYIVAFALLNDKCFSRCYEPKPLDIIALLGLYIYINVLLVYKWLTLHKLSTALREVSCHYRHLFSLNLIGLFPVSSTQLLVGSSTKFRVQYSNIITVA